MCSTREMEITYFASPEEEIEREVLFEDHEVRRNIKDIFGYYGPGVVLKVEDMHYWLMQS